MTGFVLLPGEKRGLQAHRRVRCRHLCGVAREGRPTIRGLLPRLLLVLACT